MSIINNLVLEIAASEFASNIHLLKFHDEIEAKLREENLNTMVEFQGVIEDSKTLHVNLSSLDTNIQTHIDAVVTAHNGKPITKFIASNKLIEIEMEITETIDWQVLGGVVTNPGYFMRNLKNAIGRVVGSIQTQGGDAELRLVEDDGLTEVTMHSLQWKMPDTIGSWKTFQFNNDVVPRVGENTFKLEGRLNTSTSAKIRFTSLTLLEKVL